jgi:hypothetical protein
MPNSVISEVWPLFTQTKKLLALLPNRVARHVGSVIIRRIKVLSHGRVKHLRKNHFALRVHSKEPSLYGRVRTLRKALDEKQSSLAREYVDCQLTISTDNRIDAATKLTQTNK